MNFAWMKQDFGLVQLQLTDIWVFLLDCFGTEFIHTFIPGNTLIDL